MAIRIGNTSQRNDATEAAWALENALTWRFCVLPDRDLGVVLRINNALTDASKLYRNLAHSYGLAREFILPRLGSKNGVLIVMDTLKPECICQHRFTAYDEANPSSLPGFNPTRNPVPFERSHLRRPRGASWRRDKPPALAGSHLTHVTTSHPAQRAGTDGGPNATTSKRAYPPKVAKKGLPAQ